MAATKFFLDMRGKAKDGKGSILISIYHNASTTSIATGIRVRPENWAKQRIVNLAGADAMNVNLQKQKGDLDKAIALLSLEDGFANMTAAELKKEISTGEKRKNKTHFIYQLFNDYLDTGTLKDGTKSIYYSTLKKVLSYSGENTRIESMDYKWLRGFDKFLSQTQGVNGKSIYLRSLRAVYNFARHSGITIPYPFDSFQIKHEETRKRSIPVEMLRNFYNFPTTPQLAMYRDYFFLMFYLIGINAKDLLLAEKTQVVNDRLEYIREKTGKRYSIKIEPEAYELLNKYKGSGKYLLEALDHCKHYNNFTREINDAIKEIGFQTEEVIPNMENLFATPTIVKHIKPIIPGITTYYARHTWATFAHELDISSDIIALALGHSSTNRTTFIYIKPDPKKVDDANRRVIDYFKGV